MSEAPENVLLKYTCDLSQVKEALSEIDALLKKLNNALQDITMTIQIVEKENEQL